RPPAVRERRGAPPRPPPSGPAGGGGGPGAGLGLRRRGSGAKRGAGGEGGGQGSRGGGGQLAGPRTAGRFRVDGGGVTGRRSGGGCGALGEVEEAAEPAAGDFRRELADDHAALDDDRDRRQGQADGGDAARRFRVGLVPHQPVVRVGLVQVVQDRGPLEPVQLL